MHAPMHPCVHTWRVCVPAYRWRPENDFGCSSLGAVFFVFLSWGFSLECGESLVWIDWLASMAVSGFPALGSQAHMATRSSCDMGTRASAQVLMLAWQSLSQVNSFSAPFKFRKYIFQSLFSGGIVETQTTDFIDSSCVWRTDEFKRGCLGGL